MHTHTQTYILKLNVQLVSFLVCLHDCLHIHFLFGLHLICPFIRGVFGYVGMPVYISAVRWRSRTMSWLPWRSSIALWSCWISTLAVWVIPCHHPSFIWPLSFSPPFSRIHTSHHSNTRPVKFSLLSHLFCFFVLCLFFSVNVTWSFFFLTSLCIYIVCCCAHGFSVLIICFGCLSFIKVNSLVHHNSTFVMEYSIHNVPFWPLCHAHTFPVKLFLVLKEMDVLCIKK